MPHYLGLDSSTQSLSAIVIDAEAGNIVLDESLNFGKELPEFKSPHGFLEDEDARVKHSDPLMWVAALDVLFARIKHKGFDLSSVRGVSGAGQQHGSVYLKMPLGETRFTAERSLVDQVRPLLARKTAPIWMDSSTSAECREIAAAVGGDARVTSISGSRAIERFTGPQIRRFFKTDPSAYAATREIQLVSSFIASIVSGRSAAIDFGDGAGMNLLDLSRCEFSPELMSATAPELDRKLRPAVASRTQVGTVSSYFVDKYGFAQGTPVIAFTGDNPSSLVGMGATAPGTAVVSLGTSDTVFAAMSAPRTDPRGFGHVFGNPAGGFMCLICFANGSLAREKLAERVGLDWPAFERAILKDTQPGNGGALLLPYFVPEMTPKILKPELRAFGDPEFTRFEQPARAARAIVEAQALAMQRYSDFIGEKPTKIRATGGAAKNRGILQVIADVFQAEVTTFKVGNSSALGGALRAAEAVGGVDWAALSERFCAADPGTRVTPSVGPDAYTELRRRFEAEVDALATRA